MDYEVSAEPEVRGQGVEAPQMTSKRQVIALPKLDIRGFNIENDDSSLHLRHLFALPLSRVKG